MSRITAKLAKLDEMVEWFYGEEFSLDEAVEKYQKCRELAKEIEEELEGLKNQIEVVDRDFSES